MTVIHEVQQVLWVTTPHGDGVVLFIIDYGPHENSIWVVGLERTGAIKHYSSEQVTMCYNHTMGINTQRPGEVKVTIPYNDGEEKNV